MFIATDFYARRPPVEIVILLLLAHLALKRLQIDTDFLSMQTSTRQLLAGFTAVKLNRIPILHS